MPQTEETRSRLLDAMGNHDTKYLDDYDHGRADKESGSEATGSSQGYLDGYSDAEVQKREAKVSSDDQPVENPQVDSTVGVGFHPLGGLKLYARDTTGKSVEVRLTNEEVWSIVGQLVSHAGMLTQVAYAQMAQAQMGTQGLGI